MADSRTLSPKRSEIRSQMFRDELKAQTIAKQAELRAALLELWTELLVGECQDILSGSVASASDRGEPAA